LLFELFVVGERKKRRKKRIVIICSFNRKKNSYRPQIRERKKNNLTSLIIKTMAKKGLVVKKFGGTSVGTADRMRGIVDVVK
jgi:hypothetical protein